MARSGLIALLVFAGVTAAAPASAQFPNIFGDDGPFGRNGPFGGGGPPRPPDNVPSRPPSEPQYVPPTERLPPGPPPGSRIQTQPLPPPPGAPPRPTNAPTTSPQTGQPPAAGSAALPPDQRPPVPQRGPQPATTAPQPGDEVVVEPPPRRIANPTAVFSGLDKITGRTISFDVAINETVRFGALEVTPRACYTRPPTEAPNTDAFIEVDELTLQGELKRIFTGWMFAASPGLNAVEHPIYDIWLTDCKGAPPPAVAEAPPQPGPAAAKPAPRPQQQRPPQRATQQLPPPPAPAAR